MEKMIGESVADGGGLSTTTKEGTKSERKEEKKREKVQRQLLL